jgi:hypothetical protein
MMAGRAAGVLAVWLVALSPLVGMVIRHDRDDADYRALGERFPAVGKVIPDGEATLIAPQWVITAAHVAQGIERRGGGVRFGDTLHEVGEIHLHPKWKPGQESDLALVKLQRPVVAVKPVVLYTGRKEVGRIVTFVGRGDFGTGKTGPGGQDGLLRGATNRIEEATRHWIVFAFDPPGRRSTRLEGISGPGDSGGPALAKIKGTWQILGVSSGGMSPPGGKAGMYGSREFYVRISSYLGWIQSVMEED